MAKTGSTYMTREKAAIARENIKRYDWARQQVQSEYFEPAELLLDKLDMLYDLVIGEGLPRGTCVGGEGDPDIYKCRYCGCDIGAKYGTDGWKLDPIENPWKLQCPDCGRFFPTNDFESFYKLGLNEYGAFDRALAHRKNAALVAKGEQGYLVNLLYPEMGPDWGVDDGYGYDSGRVYPNGVQEIHTYIAFYLHYGIWHSLKASSSKKEGIITKAIRTCANAYFYSGDLRYGRVAAILLDRIADFYPDYDIFQYGKRVWNSHGGSNLGKIDGRIWETFRAGDLACAYDMVFDVYEDAFVIDYLRSKSVQWKMHTPKNSAEDIRKNIEDRLLRTIFSGLVDCSISGNFGFPQRANAMAAVVLDDEIESRQWLDYLMAPGWTTQPPCHGGGINEALTDLIDGDGQGNEASAYNVAWHTALIDIADILENYHGYPAANLYRNPKFLQMFYGNLPMMSPGYTAQIGDTSRVQGQFHWMKPIVAQIGFRKLGDYRFAQALYLLNGNTTKGLHDDITCADPERLAQDVQAVIDRYGPLQYDSALMPSFGYGALRKAQHDLWMYFGGNNGHGHRDTLGIGMTAYGLNFMPELGYPEKTGPQPNRLQWVRTTLSHNTVMVDGEEQQINEETRGKVLHFEDGKKVKLLDVSAPYVYPQCQAYRRTPVMVRVSEEEAYFVDFFHVKGGNSHLLSFHASADELGQTVGLNLVPQADENGNFVGSYAGAEVPYGEDPNSPYEWFYDTKYPRGFTWTEHVLRDRNPEDHVELDFPVRDFGDRFQAGDGLRLHFTSLNAQNRDNAALSIAVMDAYPPATATNQCVKKLKYAFIHYEGENLDTVFTSVYEPYRNSRVIRRVTQLPLESGSARGVKVELASGRVDYIFYSNQGETISYREENVEICTDGIVSVYSYENGRKTDSFICDAARIGGTVRDFTRTQAEQNEILLTVERPLSDDEIKALAGRIVVVDNGPLTRGSTYQICSAKRQNGAVCLNIGRATLIRRYKDLMNTEAGFLYNIAQGQRAYIPLCTEASEREAAVSL